MGKVDQKNKRGDIYKITDAVIHLYLVYMFVIFPLVLHDGYKDITITKYNFFKNGVLALLIIMALLLVLYLTDRSGNTGHPGSDRAVSKKHTILASDVFMVLFLIAGFFAFLAAKDRMAAFTGELGRRCGFAFLLLVGAAYICVAVGCSVKEWIYPVFACVSGLTYLMSILQHLEIDLFHLYASIRFDQRPMFISTFGNINMYASFLCLTIPLFMAAGMYADKCWKRVLYTLVLFLGGMAVIAANSDVAYIGIGVPMVVLLLAGIRNRVKTYDDRMVIGQNSTCDPFLGWFIGDAGIVLGYIWQLIFNGILEKYGTALALNEWYGFWGLIILVSWQQIGYMMIIYIAGLQSIPGDVMEAAQIDGAGKWTKLFKVTIPMMMPSITICMFLSLTNGFKLFDQNLSLTAGEPSKMSEMMALNIFNTFYGRTGWEGVGQAKAVLFFVLVVAISMIQLHMTRSKEVQQ